MIVVHINPAGVEQVYFEASSDLAEDLCMAIWPLVRQDLDRLHRKLQRATKTTLKFVQNNQSPDNPYHPDHAGDLRRMQGQAMERFREK